MKNLTAAKPRSGNRKLPIERCISDKTLHLAESVYLCLGTPVSLGLLAKALRGDLLGIVDTTINPADYADPESFRDDYLAVSLLSKCPLDLGLDRQAAARDNFLKAEASCAATSKRLSLPLPTSLCNAVSPSAIISIARDKIAKWLGPLDWSEAESLFGFGPGATASSPNREGDAYHKYRMKPVATVGCADLACTAIARVPRWFQQAGGFSDQVPTLVGELERVIYLREHIHHVIGNRVTYVPKDAKKDRTIAAEPLMNGYIQKGLGGVIRRRLRRVRMSRTSKECIDLNDQTRNQRLAKEGSLSGRFATLDLRAASDSVSLRLCEMLLPDDWFGAICATRSPLGVLPSGEIQHYSKVSSMGNGCTFELESLIFLAICRACITVLGFEEHQWTREAHDLVSVYGDDIIVHRAAVPTVRWMLEFCGFELNAEKSFWTGPFRESCGKHYFSGVDVTPFYLRKLVDSVPRLIWFANQVRRWSISPIYGLDGQLKPAYDLAVSMMPVACRRPLIPNGVGDSALWGDFDEVAPPTDKFGMFQTSGWIPVFKSREYRDNPFLLRQLAGHDNHCPSCDPRLNSWVELPYHGSSIYGVEEWAFKWVQGLVDRAFRPRDERHGVRWRFVKTAPVRTWPSYGPWLEANP